MSKYTEDDLKKELETKEYEYGFYTDLESDTFPIGLNEDIVRAISNKKQEPQWMTQWRLDAFKVWKSMQEPQWANVNYTKPDFQAIAYYSAPKAVDPNKTLDDVDPELLAMYKKLGISVDEQKKMNNVAIDIVVDSVSVATTFKKTLSEKGIIFMSISEAIKEHPELVKKYLGTVVPTKDNFYASLNSAVFSDGSFCYIPKGVRCPMELNTYFRINARNTGQFERTLIIAEDDSYVSYLEGCTAPAYDENTLHAAVVELVTMDRAEIKYSTVQNWYAGDENGLGGVYNFVTKRAMCKGEDSKVSWTQVETGSAVTWKYPSCILKGDGSVGEFFSVAVTKGKQQADTGTKMIHLGKNTKSTIISKGISFGDSTNTYRGSVKVNSGAENATNFTKCDSLMLQDSRALTIPYINSNNSSAKIEHEASAGKISEEQMYYLATRGFDEDNALNLVVNGFCKDVFQKLPLEFAAEANGLLNVTLEGAVG